jgi:hypothetical protein
MDKRALLNLALLTVVAGLGALIWFDRERSSEDADQPLLFPALADATRLAVLELEPATGATAKARWMLERRGDGWWLAAPFVAPADAAAVEDLLRSLGETRSRARYAPAELDPKATGLDRPLTAFVVTGAGGETRFELGGTESLNYRRYVRSGDQVHLVDDLISYRLTQDGASLASKRLLPAGAKVVRLEIPGRTLARGADGKWTLSPADAEVSADALVALVENWEHAAATAVRARTDGVVQAMVKVALEGVAAPVELELLTAVDGLRFARRDLGLEYQLPDGARAELLELPRTAAVPAGAPATAPTPKK